MKTTISRSEAMRRIGRHCTGRTDAELSEMLHERGDPAVVESRGITPCIRTKRVDPLWSPDGFMSDPGDYDEDEIGAD